VFCSVSLLFEYMCMRLPLSPCSIAGVLRPGASGLPYYCTPPVTISAVLGVSAVKQAKEPKKKTGVLRIVGVFPLARS